MSTVKELRAALSVIDPAHDNTPIKVWLPGSTLSLGSTIFYSNRLQAVVVVGNVDPGSALEGDWSC